MFKYQTASSDAANLPVTVLFTFPSTTQQHITGPMLQANKMTNTVNPSIKLATMNAIIKTGAEGTSCTYQLLTEVITCSYN